MKRGADERDGSGDNGSNCVTFDGEDAILIEGRESVPRLNALYVPRVFSGDQLQKLREDLQSLHYIMAVTPTGFGEFCFYASDRGEWLYAAFRDQENAYQPCAWPTWLRHASFKVADAVHRTTASEREESDLSKVPRFLYNSAMIYWHPTILRNGTISTNQRQNASEADRWCKENTPNSYVFTENTSISLIPSDDLKRAEMNASLKTIKIFCRAGSCLSLKVSV